MEEITVEVVVCAACAKPGVRGRTQKGEMHVLVHCSCRTTEEVPTIQVHIEVAETYQLWGTRQKRAFDWSVKPISKGVIK